MKTICLSPDDVSVLDKNFLTKQLITYIGNKRKLLPFINKVIEGIKAELGGRDLVTFDGFSGSGSVARLLKLHSKVVYVCDLEGYSQTLNGCYLADPSREEMRAIIEAINEINRTKYRLRRRGFIAENYAPKDDKNIQPGERVFYTTENAELIDGIRSHIETLPEWIRPFILGPLLVEASIHTNTSGVFRGFHKKNGVGHFGGAKESGLNRIKELINLEIPEFSPKTAQHQAFRGDVLQVVQDLPVLDVAYYDPPYNQHPYGSNYFMLNLINDGKPSDIQTGVSGITRDWNRSSFNSRVEAAQSLEALMGKTRARVIVLSYNNEGIISEEEMWEILRKHGDVMRYDIVYDAYHGGRNNTIRCNKVVEYLWLIRKTY